MIRCLIVALGASIPLVAVMTTGPRAQEDTDAVARVLDDLHEAASKAQGKRYFDLFAPDGVFFGTDDAKGPANFLDVGGSATDEAVTEAFRIILSDKKVQGVLVNIFGGIMQCDKIARAIVTAAKEVGFTVPLVVRLEGTNVEEARRILDEARNEIPSMVTATDLTDAAKKVCAAVSVTA